MATPLRPTNNPPIASAGQAITVEIGIPKKSRFSYGPTMAPPPPEIKTKGQPTTGPFFSIKKPSLSIIPNFQPLAMPPLASLFGQGLQNLSLLMTRCGNEWAALNRLVMGLKPSEGASTNSSPRQEALPPTEAESLQVQPSTQSDAEALDLFYEASLDALSEEALLGPAQPEESLAWAQAYALQEAFQAIKLPEEEASSYPAEDFLANRNQSVNSSINTLVSSYFQSEEEEDSVD